MNKHRRETAPATRTRAKGTRTGMLATLAIAALAVATGGCTMMIDQELSTKTGAGGAGGGSGGGGDVGGTGNAGQTTGTPQTTTSQTTTSQTATAPCPQGCELAQATAVCQGGECVIVDCEQGFADCNKATFDGCEAELFHDDENCGKCKHACNTNDGQSCEEGKCK